MKFKALIDGVHFDPKKGIVKIVLIATLHDVSLDELATLSPKDESIHVTFESEQTKILDNPLTPYGVTLEGEEAAVKLKEAADRLKEIDADGDEVERGGQGGII